MALPIETVKTVAPTPGAFAAFRDKSLERGWRLQVNREGITLNCSEEDDVAPALFDYLRMALGCAFYAPGCEKLPKTPIAALPAIDRQTKPHYQAMLHSNHYPLMSGGKKRDLRYICNDVNYYHLNDPDWIHVLNTTLPAELYYKEHPEYFMMDSNGNRVVSFRPSYTHQCFSNPDARRIMLKGLTDITKAQPGLHRMCFERHLPLRISEPLFSTVQSKGRGQHSHLLLPDRTRHAMHIASRLRTKPGRNQNGRTMAAGSRRRHVTAGLHDLRRRPAAVSRAHGGILQPVRQR